MLRTTDFGVIDVMHQYFLVHVYYIYVTADLVRSNLLGFFVHARVYIICMYVILSSKRSLQGVLFLNSELEVKS